MEELNNLELKREVQITIVPTVTNLGRATEEEFFNILRMVAPSTNLRAGLDGALKAGKGALIVIENESVQGVLDGGFKINCKFTPQKLIELTKMDGAIVLSEDVKRIDYANVLLTPDSKIKTEETGTRHKAAERTAKQTGTLVIAISERRNEITLFYKDRRYPLKSTDEVLRKANGHVQILEKQKELFDNNVAKLNKLELKDHPSLNQAVNVIQKGRFILRISQDLKQSLLELGNEGILLKTRLKELLYGVEKELNFVVQDYTKLGLRKSRILLDSLSYDEILDSENIFKLLAYDKGVQANVRGWRILSRTGLQESEIAKLVKIIGGLDAVMHSSVENYSLVLGEEKAQQLKSELERIKAGVF